MVRLEAVLDTWRSIRQDTAQAVEDFPSSELDYKPVPDVAAFGDIARHILVVGHGAVGMLLEGADDFNSAEVRAKIPERSVPLPEKPDAATLASALRSSLETRCAELAAQSPEFYSQIITRFDGRKVTRLEMVQFLKEHELTHRQQLFMYLRLKGIVPSTTRRKLLQQQQQQAK
jgi:uncharacterized damage-inducible protein DinB